MLKKRNLLFLSLLIMSVFLLSSCFLNPPATEGILKGQVMVPEGSIQAKDLTGQALPDATVNIIDLETGAIIAAATTDANGYYQISVPPGGPYLLEVIKDGVKVQQITPQVEVGIEYDLGTADCTTTAVALIVQAMMDAGTDLADINLADIEADPHCAAVTSSVTDIIQAGGDPTVSTAIQQAVEDFLNPPAPAPTPTPAPTPLTAIAAITGIAQVGEVLTAGALTPAGAKATYQWQIAELGGTYTDIAGATLSTYIPAAGDTTKFIKVQAIGTGNYTDMVTSDPTEAVANGDQAVPTGLTGVAPTTSGGTDGKITGTTTAMEYKLLSGSTYTACLNTETTGLAADTYHVRYAAKIGYNAGIAAEVVVPVAVTGVSLNQATTTSATGATETLLATVLPADADNKAITWASDNESAATIDSSGVVTGVSAGTATITVTTVDGGFTDTCTVTVGCFTFDSSTNTITDYDVTCGGLDVVIPSAIGGVAVVNIGDSAFKEKVLNSVIIPDSVITIGDSAFRINKLTSVTIGNSVTTIGWCAFQYNKLTSVTIPDSVTSIGDFAFGSNKLTLVTIGNSVTSIGKGAFANNDLTLVTIPDSVTTIGDSAFDNNLLTLVTIPDSVTTIGYRAFASNDLTLVTIGNSVTSIGKGAFAFNDLTLVTIPDSVTSIGDIAFAANDLILVTIGNSVTSIGDYAFYQNQLTSVTIPDSVTSIGDGVFADNDLISVTIPDSVMTIGEGAFADNDLTSVTIGSGVVISYYLYTMGTNTGFKTVYDVEGAGTYNYTVGAWAKD